MKKSMEVSAFIPCRKPLETPGNPWKPLGNCIGNPDWSAAVLSHKKIGFREVHGYIMLNLYMKNHTNGRIGYIFSEVDKSWRCSCIALLPGEAWRKQWTELLGERQKPG